MSEKNEALVRTAYEAYARGDTTQMLTLVHPDLEWTFLDPAFQDPEPRVCHGRGQLAQQLERLAGQGLIGGIETIASAGDKVMVVFHTPGIDQTRVRQAQDRNYLVLTLREGQVVAMRACRDLAEAQSVTGLC
jgi:ketosteroid isomerase-like protein